MIVMGSEISPERHILRRCNTTAKNESFARAELCIWNSSPFIGLDGDELLTAALAVRQNARLTQELQP